MDYLELMESALPDLAGIALDLGADAAARIAAYEAIAARKAEIIGSWSGFTPRERALLRSAFALDADTMARRGFIPAA